MVTKWLHVTESGGNPWVLPIWTSINHAISKGACAEPTDYARELGIHITTRLNMLPIIVRRINAGWKTLHEETVSYGDEYISVKGHQGYAAPVKPETINSLLVDIDSFLFETNSCCELMACFLREVYKMFGQNIETKDTGRKLKEILVGNEQDPKWFTIIKKDRNFFIHEGTPYIAVDISSDIPDLLIMKENLNAFDDPAKFTCLSELDIVLKGFSEAISILQEHVIKLCGQ